MSTITTPREFLARRLAHERLIRTGKRAQACSAARLAARLYAAGASVDAAARRAAQQIGGDATLDPFGGTA
jgi:hypothetical protein